MAGKFMRSNHDPNNILVTGADIDIDIKALLLSSHILPPSSHQHHHHLQSLRNYHGVLGGNSKQPLECKERRAELRWQELNVEEDLIVSQLFIIYYLYLAGRTMGMFKLRSLTLTQPSQPASLGSNFPV